MSSLPAVSHGSILIPSNGEKLPPFEDVNVLVTPGSDFVTEVRLQVTVLIFYKYNFHSSKGQQTNKGS